MSRSIRSVATKWGPSTSLFVPDAEEFFSALADIAGCTLSTRNLGEYIEIRIGTPYGLMYCLDMDPGLEEALIEALPDHWDPTETRALVGNIRNLTAEWDEWINEEEEQLVLLVDAY